MPEQRHDCAGGCGKSVRPNQVACLPCWDLLPHERRVAIKNHRGVTRQALIVEAREWFVTYVREGRLIETSQETTKATFSLARAGDFVPPPAGTKRAGPTTVELPAGRVGVTHVLAKGAARPATAPEPFNWHTFGQPDGTTLLVLSRPKRRHEDEIALDYDGNPVDHDSTGGVFVYPGARTLAEAYTVHHAWRAWRSADHTSRGSTAAEPHGDVERLRRAYEQLLDGLTDRGAVNDRVSA